MQSDGDFVVYKENAGGGRSQVWPSNTARPTGENYIAIMQSTCKYLYRAVDKEGSTIEFMLSAKRDVSAAKRFFKKMMRAEHRRRRERRHRGVRRGLAWPRLTPLCSDLPTSVTGS